MIPFPDYLQRGLIKRQRPDFAQIGKQISRARLDLETVEKILHDDPEWASSIAYQSMLRAGRALLFAHGYLPSGGGQHRTVVELAGKILGEGSSDLIRQFNRFRKKRNLFFYDSEDTGNIGEAETALQISASLLERIQKYIDGLNPQLTIGSG